ncbi:MAG TPA: hypothetical protein PKA00_21490 [Saprospiraceae bacterium]|nr:hypothetical protein [Saprospiraceae bacterium]HMQ85499.1 hypothetical protein [Saprospiraceae bacterium]
MKNATVLVKNVIKIVSISLLLLTGLNAVVAGVLFILDPSGAKMGMSVEYLKYAPFRSFLIPGIVLFVANGVLNFAAAIAIIKNKAYSHLFTIFQGAVLCGWILIQVMMVRDVNPLHAIMLTIGILLMACGYMLKKTDT